MSAIGWTSIQAALAAWITASTGVSTVLWAFQAGPQTPRPFVSLELQEVDQPGLDWTVKDFDESRGPGREIRRRARGQRVAQLRLQFFADAGSGGLGAMSLGSDAIAALPLYADDIDAAGAGVGKVGTLQSIEGRRGTILEPRAVVPIALHVSSEVERFESYIARAEVTLNDVRTLWVPEAP
jgi:hypothetical protein